MLELYGDKALPPPGGDAEGRTELAARRQAVSTVSTHLDSMMRAFGKRGSGGAQLPGEGPTCLASSDGDACSAPGGDHGSSSAGGEAQAISSELDWPAAVVAPTVVPAQPIAANRSRPAGRPDADAGTHASTSAAVIAPVAPAPPPTKPDSEAWAAPSVAAPSGVPASPANPFDDDAACNAPATASTLNSSGVGACNPFGAAENSTPARSVPPTRRVSTSNPFDVASEDVGASTDAALMAAPNPFDEPDSPKDGAAEGEANLKRVR